MEWLKRIIRKLLGKKEPEPKREPKPSFTGPLIQPHVILDKHKRRGIQSTDLGMRKLSRHRKGRLYDKQSGFDPDKRMVDIEDNQTRKRKKKRSWAVDRK